MPPESPAFLDALVDDAAIFPPGNVPLDQAVKEHHGHREAPYAGLVGGFVASDTRLADLAPLADPDRPLDLNVVVTGGAGALEPAVRWSHADGLRLRALEIALRDGGGLGDDLARNASRVAAMVDNLRREMGDDVEVYVEPPRRTLVGDQAWLAALDEISMAGLRLKFRTGGVTADAFPSVAELASSIDAALDRETPFKCTAGLHDAVRHTDPETGFEHHGFLNVLLATRVALDGGDIEAALSSAEPATQLPAPEACASARRWFTSFGSCSVLDVHEDLVDLDLWKDEA
jgi:hypothetical protein